MSLKYIKMCSTLFIRLELQIEIILFLPIRLARIKKNDNTQC